MNLSMRSARPNHSRGTGTASLVSDVCTMKAFWTDRIAVVTAGIIVQGIVYLMLGRPTQVARLAVRAILEIV